MSRVVVMTGGGTGGHLAIIRAVKEVLKDEELIYIGSESGQDRAWFGSDKDFSYRYFLNTEGVADRSGLKKVISLYNILKATKESLRLLKRHKVDAVFSVGGYSAAPVGISSKLLSTPLIIHEQNAVLGSLNRLLKPYSCTFLSSFGGENSSAYPIKDIFFQSARVRKSFKSIFFVGGSQGAAAINHLALSMAEKLKNRGIKIIHQAGERNVDEVKRLYRELNIDAEVFGFSDKIDIFMKKADFAIARAGASTLWELSANGVPTIFIPYPYAFADHQFFNAKYLVDRDLAWVMRENEIDLKKIWQILDGDFESLSRRLIEFTPRDGSIKIAEAILKCIEK
jgi:UDP-N-acetylglucosamine--N-acetylmuramyl-(pentapeptide) pyrophosphoryl-undecaprenol N-acetylglucosamine transferase